MDKPVIFQYSIISALMDGVASHGLPLSDLLTHGDTGLGTFRHMAGEMIVLDGQAYQMKSDGSVSAIDPAVDAVSPFAVLTRFRPMATYEARIDSKKGLAELLSRLMPSTRNQFLAFRVDGSFRRVAVRTVGGQTYEHEGLAELGQHQVTHDFSDVRGTLIGFRSPAYMEGISVVGDHLHFITDDRKAGGHVTEVETVGPVPIQAMLVSTINLELPTGDEEFNEAKLERDGEGIAKVEG
jgi:alpha-acetolactate decarboxylase